MQIGLLITSRCNAACTHCATSCGPNKTEALPKAKIMGLMDEAADINDGRPLVFSLSGGEPFLDFPQLLEVVAYGTRLGGEVTCVTNGYWASSDEKAQSMIGPLRRAGLVALGVSTSQFHQRFVRLDRVKRALTVAIEHGIGTVLKYAMTKSDEREVDGIRLWAQSVGVRRVETFPVLPYLREGRELPNDEYLMKRGLPKGRCPIPSLTVREDGTAYSCCAPGGFVNFLSFGKVPDHGLRSTYHRFLLQGKQKVLREKGPIHFARAIRRQGFGRLLRKSYAGVCDLCAHIASDPVLSSVAEDTAATYQQKVTHPFIRELIARHQPSSPKEKRHEEAGS